MNTENQEHKHRKERRFRAAARGHTSVPKGALFSPPVDIYEADESFMVLADVPGADPQRIDVSVKGDEMALTAPVQDGESGEAMRREYCVGHWYRTFHVEGVDADSAEASLNNGVLKIVLPKTEYATPRKVEIKQE